MGIVDGKTPYADRANAIIRVVIKLSDRGSEHAGAVHPNSDSRMVSVLRQAAPGAEFKPYLAEHEQLRAASVAPFNRYLVVEAGTRDAADDLVRRLSGLAEVEDVYAEAGPVPPPTVNASDDPRNANQNYLDAAPTGIDARWAWSLASGAGIRFVDMERGWTLNHEDLAGAGITVISGVNQDWHGHGTAVLGEVVAVDNQLGGVGIAPDANARVVSQWRTTTTYDTAAAILSAGQSMSKGDVLLLEAQSNSGTWNLVPVEVETAVFDAIRYVVDAGIVVVEASGNGGNDLDAFVNSANRHVLDLGSADFRDSGAILVGAASSTLPHKRLSFSNFGSRIDCYGWGENIDTTGDGYTGNTTTAYTSGFGGTSGASPIVAGAALLIQSWRKSVYGQTFDPDALRVMLSNGSHNTKSDKPATDKIGVMPNVRGIIETEIANDRYRLKHENYMSLVYILFGLINDAPGMIWVPGKGPVPVDPGWGRLVTSLAAEKRDLLAAMAINEIAESMQDPIARDRLAHAATDAMHRAVDRMAQRG